MNYQSLNMLTIYKGGQNMLSLYAENDYFKNKELYKLKKK